MEAHCYAFRQNKVQQLPVKSKKISKRRRYFNFLLFNCGPHLLIEKRVAKDIWKNLYQFPLIETTQLLENQDDLLQQNFSELPLEAARLIRKSRPFRQLLTHQEIIATFWELDLSELPSRENNSYLKVLRENLSKFAFPKVIDLYLKDKSLYLM
ncbi:MAG: NUDIX domain-containing protein [Bacteroidota bacterium]